MRKAAGRSQNDGYKQHEKNIDLHKLIPVKEERMLPTVP